MQRELRTTKSLYDIALAPVEEMPWIVPGIIPGVGLTLLAGRPKTRKSWLALHLAQAVAAGADAFGTGASEAGDVLYLALEDSEQRLQNRTSKMLEGGAPPSALARVTVAHKWPALDRGGMDDIRAWLDAHPDARLVIVDTFAKVRPAARRGSSAYGEDYAALGPLQALAMEKHVAIIVVTHTNKRTTTDPFDEISGTTGLPGAADTAAVLRPIEDDGARRAVLYLRGRDVDEQSLLLEWDASAHRWRHVGGYADAPNLSPERRRVLDALCLQDEPVTPKELADILGEKPANVQKHLISLGKTGLATNKSSDFGRWSPTPEGKELHTRMTGQNGQTGQSGMTGQSGQSSQSDRDLPHSDRAGKSLNAHEFRADGELSPLSPLLPTFVDVYTALYGDLPEEEEAEASPPSLGAAEASAVPVASFLELDLEDGPPREWGEWIEGVGYVRHRLGEEEEKAMTPEPQARESIADDDDDDYPDPDENYSNY